MLQKMDTKVILEKYSPLPKRPSIVPRSNRNSEPQNSYRRHTSFIKLKNTTSEFDKKAAAKTLREAPFFASMQRDEHEKEQLLRETCDALDYETFMMGDIIFHNRDKGSKFYIILQGQVDIYVPKTEQEVIEDIMKIESSIRKKLKISQGKGSTEFKELLEEYKPNKKPQFISPMEPLRELADETSARLKVKKVSRLVAEFKSYANTMGYDSVTSLLDCEGYFQIYHEEMICKFKKVKTLGPGAYFGEIALSSDCLRSATIVAASDLNVATLSREAFKHISRDFDRNIYSKIDFFAKLTGRNPGEAIARFCYDFKERHYTYGQKVFMQGETPSEVFVVKQGEVQITTQEKACSAMPSTPRGKMRSTEKIANLGPYNLIGEGEALAHKSYDITAISSSNDTVLYVLPVREFTYLKSSYPEIFEKFLNKHDTKVAYFQQRAEDLSTTKKKILNLSYNPEKTESKSARNFSTFFDISQVHSSKLIEKRLEQISKPPSSCSPRRMSIKTPRSGGGISPENLLTEFNLNNLNSPVCRTSGFKPLAKIRNDHVNTSKDMTPRPTDTEESTFGNYMELPNLVHSPLSNRDLIRTNQLKLPKFFHKFVNKTFNETKRDPITNFVKTYREMNYSQNDASKIVNEKEKDEIRLIITKRNKRPNLTVIDQKPKEQKVGIVKLTKIASDSPRIIKNREAGHMSNLFPIKKTSAFITYE